MHRSKKHSFDHLKFAKAERDRGSQLVKSNYLSQETFDQRTNADEVAKAASFAPLKLMDANND
jgi:multidrug resistance efflux pump